MKVCGFSFIRNGVRLGYPFEESIRSVLPLCDAFYIAVGRSDDDTLNRVRSLDPKIVVVETVWDDSLKTGGAVLADETNKAFRAIPADYDWAFYIQGDELIHEKDVPAIRSALEQYSPAGKFPRRNTARIPIRQAWPQPPPPVCRTPRRHCVAWRSPRCNSSCRTTLVRS